MTEEEREKAIDLLDNLIGMIEDNQDNDYDKALKMGIESLRKEPCADAVSRKAIVEMLNARVQGSVMTFDHFIELLYKLPSVTPTECIAKITFNKDDLQKLVDEKVKEITVEHKKGHWVLLDDCSNSGYYCSECHKKVVKDGWSNTVKKIKYCPNCGAEMESEK